MRIIDKNTDFYDFYQNLYPDKTFTFDRRDSYTLTKDIMCDHLTVSRFWSWKEKKNKDYRKYNYMLLQIGNAFWLFRIKIIEITDYDRVKDYKVELLDKWKDFNKPRKLINLEVINILRYTFSWSKHQLTDKDYVNAVKAGDYEVKRNLNKYTVWIGGDKKVEKHIPLLKASGLAPLMDAHEVFLALEQYFALEKSDSERREPLGATNEDKIESHGFDRKISFRGK